MSESTNFTNTKRRAFVPEEDSQGIIAGRNPVLEALKSGTPLDSIYIDSEATGSIGKIVAVAGQSNVVIKRVNSAKLNSMFTGNHQGVVATIPCAEYVEIEDLLAAAKKSGEPAFIIIADEIEDPHNLGAIIRSAEAAGVNGIIIPKRRSASLSPTVYKTSAGAASYVPVARVPNLSAAIDELKSAGVWIYGADMDGEAYNTTDLTGDVALVIGAEGNGIGRLIREKCDFILSLPMKGKISSLNASVAAGILMYEVVRQRGSAQAQKLIKGE